MPKSVAITLADLPPSSGWTGGSWKIDDPWFKLALKYGINGSAGDVPNRTRAFDRYAMGRSLNDGPNIADLSVTTLMSSSVRADGIAGVDAWLQRRRAKMLTAALRSALRRGGGHLNEPVVDAVVTFVEAAVTDADLRAHIGPVQTFKWLSAWAPQSVPMIDRHVHELLAGSHPLRSLRARTALENFATALASNREILVTLGVEIGQAAKLPAAVSPVRVLDSLLWMEQWGIFFYDPWNTYFETAKPRGDRYDVTASGRAAREIANRSWPR